MSFQDIPESFRKFEIPGQITFAMGRGSLHKINVAARQSTAEIYLHGAHITGFQKSGEPPLLFLSRKSRFAPSEAIRGGVPICFPWFGPRDGEPAHGFARILPWDLTGTSVAEDGAITMRLQLPKNSVEPEWSVLRTDFIVTFGNALIMELVVANESADRTLEYENCLHTYFHVGDIGAVSITGLENLPFDDFAAGAGGARKLENEPVLRIVKETNRIYPDHTGKVEIRDDSLKRTICVEKFNSHSTVVWNPWTTQKLPDDFDPTEHKNMVCVESGNVKQNRISLPPGATTALKVMISSKPF